MCHRVAIKFWQSKANGMALVISNCACIVGFINLSTLYIVKMASQFHQESTPSYPAIVRLFPPCSLFLSFPFPPGSSLPLSPSRLEPFLLALLASHVILSTRNKQQACLNSPKIVHINYSMTNCNGVNSL